MGAPKQVLRTLFLNNPFWVGENIRVIKGSFVILLAKQTKQAKQARDKISSCPWLTPRNFLAYVTLDCPAYIKETWRNHTFITRSTISKYAHTCQPSCKMTIYTHFRHFSLLHTHIFHIFSILNLNNMLDYLVLKYAHGLEKHKNDDKKWNMHGITYI